VHLKFKAPKKATVKPAEKKRVAPAKVRDPHQRGKRWLSPYEETEGTKTKDCGKAKGIKEDEP
jgi:hypothetical protein